MGKVTEKTIQVWTIEEHEWSNFRCMLNTIIHDAVRDTHSRPITVAQGKIASEVINALPGLLAGMGIEIDGNT